MPTRFRWSTSLPAGLLLAAGCVDVAVEGDGADEPASGVDSPGDSAVELPVAERARLRRLSRREIDAVLKQVLGVDAGYAALFLPADARTPFDNDASQQEPSTLWAEGLERLAIAAATEVDLVEGPAAAHLACSLDALDEACLQGFAASLGRVLHRRPVDEAFAEDLVATASAELVDAPEPVDAIRYVIAGLLLDLGFTHVLERGVPDPDDPDVLALDDWSLATRIAFLVTGRGPDEALLAEAEAGRLVEPEVRVAEALRLLATDEAREHFIQFHADWLGYRTIYDIAAIAEGMRTEADALVTRVLFDEGLAWGELFTFPETYLDQDLALQYGAPQLQPEEDYGWVDLTGTDRRGILSTGAYLSVAANPLDTSPSKRGKVVLERLACQEVLPPPPTVETVLPTEVDGALCKTDRLSAHTTNPGCAVCHDAMDGAGLGLEGFDTRGRPRDYEPHPIYQYPLSECPIDGEGHLDGVGPFTGPAGLGQVLVDSGTIQACALRHVVAFAMGRSVDFGDETPSDAWLPEIAEAGGSLDAVIATLVGSEVFARATWTPEGE